MPVALVNERFPIWVKDDGDVVTQYLPVRTLWDGDENQLFVFNPAIEQAVISCHGVGAAAHQYANNGMGAADLAGKQATTRSGGIGSRSLACGQMS
jgi:hypothetical protein